MNGCEESRWVGGGGGERGLMWYLSRNNEVLIVKLLQR